MRRRTVKGSLTLGVEIGQSLGEASANAVLLVERKGTLDGGVAKYVSVCEHLGGDASAWLLFLRDVLIVVVCGLAAG